MRILALSVMTLTLAACGSKNHDHRGAHAAAKPKPVVAKPTVTTAQSTQAAQAAKVARQVKLGELSLKIKTYKALNNDFNASYVNNPKPSVKDIAVARMQLEQMSVLSREIQASPFLSETDKASITQSRIQLDMWKSALAK